MLLVYLKQIGILKFTIKMNCFFTAPVCIYCTARHTLSSMNHWSEMDPTIIWNATSKPNNCISWPVGVTFPPRVPRVTQEGVPLRALFQRAQMRMCTSLALWQADLLAPCHYSDMVSVSHFSEDKLTGPHLSRRHNHRVDGPSARESEKSNNLVLNLCCVWWLGLHTRAVHVVQEFGH